MEIEIKKAVKAGNSSAVILPRAWLNQEVRVELVKKSNKTILLEVIDIIKEYVDIERIIGIYLVGSYARNEETKDSDIDILVINDCIDKPVIKEGIYNILIISAELLKQKLENDLFPIGQMIKEAKPLINSSYLDSIEVKITKKNVKWYIDTTKEKLELIKEILENKEKEIDNRVIYTLVLRIRTLYITQKLINNQDYSNKKFLKLIKRISGSNNAYNSYLSVKNNSKEKNLTKKQEAEKLYPYLKKQLDDVKKLLKY
jgi:predicted nucleotidyltransferase